MPFDRIVIEGRGHHRPDGESLQIVKAYLAGVDSLAREGVVVGSHLGGLSATVVLWWTVELLEAVMGESCWVVMRSNFWNWSMCAN